MNYRNQDYLGPTFPPEYDGDMVEISEDERQAIIQDYQETISERDATYLFVESGVLEVALKRLRDNQFFSDRVSHMGQSDIDLKLATEILANTLMSVAKED